MKSNRDIRPGAMIRSAPLPHGGGGIHTTPPESAPPIPPRIRGRLRTGLDLPSSWEDPRSGIES